MIRVTIPLLVPSSVTCALRTQPHAPHLCSQPSHVAPSLSLRLRRLLGREVALLLRRYTAAILRRYPKALGRSCAM